MLRSGVLLWMSLVPAVAAAQEPVPPPEEEPARDVPARGSDDEGAPEDRGESPLEIPEPGESLRDVSLSDSVITPTRGRRWIVGIPQAVNALTAEEIARRLPQTTPDALTEEVGVVVQKTNMGGGSPVIRGRTGKEILILLDGLRFNNSTFRRNHQYLNTIDLNAVDRIEVIRGPASVLYGSDAMGGAVNVFTRRYDLDQPGFHGRLYSEASSANLGLVTHLALEGGTGDIGVTAGATYKTFDDLRAGQGAGDPVGAVDQGGRQVPTGYDEYDISFTMNSRLSDHETLDFLYLYSQAWEVPRSDVLIPNDERPVAPDLRRDFDPQILRWYEARYRYGNAGELVERFEAKVMFANPEETRRRIRTSDPDTQVNETDEILTPGIGLQWDLRVAEDHLLTTGAEGYYEQVRSSRESVDLTTGAVDSDLPGRFPDGSVYQSYGVYAQDEWQIAEDWRWTGGLRYSLFKMRLDFEDLTIGPVGPIGTQSETFDDLTFATGLTHRVSESTWVYGSISQGFRAPNLDDVAVLGDFASGERVPNLDLDPETVWSFEAGAKHRGPRWRGGGAAAAAFYDNLFDTEVAFTAGGQEFFQVANRGRATVYTLEGWAEYVTRESDGASPEHVLFANAFGNWGYNRTAEEPLSKVPPPQGELGYRLEDVRGRWFGEIFARGALEQNRLSQADLDDPRIPDDGTPAWWTLNLRGGILLGDHVNLRAAIENLFDYRYRVHGSGIDAAGINFVAQLDWRF
jgi:outer membrane receptor protein involved in Fe transport